MPARSRQGSGAADPRRARLVVAAAFWLFGLGAVGALVILLRPQTGAGEGLPRPVPVRNVQVGEETPEALIRSASTPVLAVNPSSPANLALGYRIERPAYSCAMATSFDAGVSWSQASLPLPEGAERCYTTSLAFAPDGTLYLAFVTLEGPSNVAGAGWLTRSTDGGRTLQAPRQVLDKERFMVRLALDPRASPPSVILTWVEPSGIGLFQMAPPSPVMMSVSSDGGATFGQPVQVSDSRRERVGAPVPLVGPDGAIHVLYYDYGTDIFDFQNQPGRYEGTFELVLATSTDGGSRFSETVVDADVTPPEPFMVFTPPFPAFAVGPERGDMYAAWSDARLGISAVLLRHSRDEGRTWTPAIRVDDGRGQALLPQVAVAGNGRLDVAYASVGAGEGRPTEIHLTSSADRGRAFGPAQALNLPFRREWLPQSPRREVGRDLGSALALVSGDREAYAAWPDTRRGGVETFRVDIVGAPVRIALDAQPRQRPNPTVRR